MSDERPVRAETCRVCDRVFQTQSNRRVMACSTTCYEWVRRHPGQPRPDIGRPCPICGDPVMSEHAATVYCSRRCRAAVNKRRNGHGGRPVTSEYQVFTECQHCGASLAGRRAGTKFCSTGCEGREYAYPGSFALRAGRRCDRCGDPLAASERINRRYCSVRCQVYANQDIRRARKRGLPAERFSEVEIFERDGWVCHLCSSDVDPVIRAGPMMASLDHLIPFTVPGCPGHVRSNVALAHLTCNISKRDRVRPEDWALHYRLAGMRVDDAG